MNWGWMAVFLEEVKEQNRQLQENRREREKEQSENWKTIARSITGSRLFLFFAGKIRSKERAGWFERNGGTLTVVIIFATLIGSALTPMIVDNYVGSSREGDHAAWIVIVKLLVLVGLLLFPFALGKRKFDAKRLSAMRLVRLDQQGMPNGREVPMTRQDMNRVCSIFCRPARFLGLGSFGIWKYSILVDKDYKRAFTLYFNSADRLAFRASRHFWNWHLTEEEGKQFYEIMDKYVDRLGQTREERNDQ